MSVRLSFGTAGIRAALGPGLDQINPYTVGAVAHALCAYLSESDPSSRERGVCIGYDGRTDSDLFAREVARVAHGHGFLLRAFERPVPTPLLAFCTRLHGAAAGVMITASHNPPHENGLKIFLAGGAQVLAPHDREIASRIASFDPTTLPSARAVQRSMALGQPEVDAYLAALGKLVRDPSRLPLPSLAYSALCGVGSALTRAVLAQAGAERVFEVATQAAPRSDFGGLLAPNPEHVSALGELLALADEQGAQLAFAHDPDADRLAVAVRDRTGTLRLLSGDDVGALLGTFMLEQAERPERALLVSTLVSGELLERVARAKGARFERTPTGFKWIAARARKLEREAGLCFVFGYEEAIGYAFGQLGDDKDGIAALSVLLELARRLHAEGLTLLDQLDALSRTHGSFGTRQLTVALAGDRDVMARLRALDPSSWLGPGTTRVDYAQEAEAIDLLLFRREDGARVCVRPSGTEPKVKFYLHARAEVTGELAQARTRLQQQLDELAARVRSVV